MNEQNKPSIKEKSASGQGAFSSPSAQPSHVAGIPVRWNPVQPESLDEIVERATDAITSRHVEKDDEEWHVWNGIIGRACEEAFVIGVQSWRKKMDAFQDPSRELGQLREKLEEAKKYLRRYQERYHGAEHAQKLWQEVDDFIRGLEGRMFP
jgi:hypothetical protein